MSDDKGPGPSQDLNTRPPRSKVGSFSPFSRIWLILFVIVIVLVIAVGNLTTTRWIFSEGYVITDHETELHTPFAATIEAFEVQSDDIVKEGQTLVRFNTDDLQARLKEAQAVAVSKARRIEQMQSKHALHREQQAKDIEQARHEFAMSEAMVEQIARTPDEYPEAQKVEAQRRFELAKSELEEANLNHAVVMIHEMQHAESEKAAADQRMEMLKTKIENSRVRSPLSGRVQFNDFNVGEVVKPEHVLGQVFDESTWIVKLKISERDYRHVEVGHPVTVSITAYPTYQHGYATGHISHILDVVTPQVTGDGVYYAEATITDFGQIKPAVGQSARVWIDTGETSYLRYLLGY